MFPDDALPAIVQVRNNKVQFVFSNLVRSTVQLQKFRKITRELQPYIVRHRQYYFLLAMLLCKQMYLFIKQARPN